MNDELYPGPTLKPQPRPTNRGHVVRRAALVSAGTGLSRVLGFIRDMLIAYFLGAGVMADVFLAVLRLPNILRRLLTEGAVAMPFIPAYLGLVQTEGEPRADAFAKCARAWALWLSSLFCVPGLAFPLPVLLAVAPGLAYRLPELPGGAAFAELLMRVSLLYVPPIVLSCVNSALLQSRGNYLAPALAPCILNVCFILPLLGLLAVGQVDFFQHTPQGAHLAALALVWALPLAGVCQMFYLGGSLRRGGFKAPEKARRRDKAVFSLGRILPSSLCVTASHQIALLIAVMAASFLPEGYITQVHFADQMIELPLGLFGMALAAAVLPSFSALAAPERRAELREALALSLRLVSFVALPATAGLFGLAFPLVDALFGHGAFDMAAVAGCSALLSGYVLCLPALAAIRPLIAAIHALQRTRAAALAALASFAVTGLACSVVVWLSPLLPLPEVRSLALGLAVSLGAMAFAVLLLRILALDDAAPALGGVLKELALPALLSLGIAVFCRMCAAAFPAYSFWLIVVLVPGCVLAYAGVCLVCKRPETEFLLALVIRRRAKKM